jgi:hypothetical protein
MYNDATRGYVFRFSGSNYLQISASTLTNSTKTFWLSSSTPSTGQGNVFSSNNFAVWFQATSTLKFYPGNSGTIYTSTTTQTITWIFYAITTSNTKTYMYINGSSSSNAGCNISAGWSGDTNPIQFGAYAGSNYYTGYMDDMRLYPSVLTSAEILQIYNGG